MISPIQPEKKEPFENNLLFAEEEAEDPSARTNKKDPWKVLVIDDDKDIHELTRMVLRNVTVDDRPVAMISGYSGQDACRILKEDSSIGVLLLDVVMETEYAGLEVVRTIREQLGNERLRILLRTGQAGQAPELDVISRYDINDYREKTSLTSQQLITSVTTAIRAFRDLQTIEHLAERLRGEREILKRAQSIAHIGNWNWDPDSDWMTISEELAAILGLEGRAFGGRMEHYRACVHPEDRQRVEEAIRSIQKGADHFEMEYRVVRPDHSARIVRALGERLEDDRHQKNPLLIGTVHDITRQRQAEDNYKMATSIFGGAMQEVESQLNLMAKVFENAIEGVVVMDEKGIIQTVNAAFTTITGYTEKDARGNSPDFLRSPDQDDRLCTEKRLALREKGLWKGEVWNRRKDGEAYAQWETITAISDQKGKIIHYVSIFHDLSDIKAREKLLHFRTHHDTLTDLPNRDLFFDRLKQAIIAAQRTKAKVLVLFLGLDHFKHINNSLGHGLGDQLLQGVAHRFRAFMREGDTLCRLGGDAFGFIIRDIQTVKVALIVVQKLIGVLIHPFRIGTHTLHVTASSGITLFPDDGQDAETLIKHADIALNRAKAAGRNTMRFYTEAMGQQADRRLHLENNLRLALERHEFVLYYQPKLSLAKDQIIGMEALVRWQHPTADLISPAEFIPVAEETGLIIPLGQWILHEACRQTKAWIDEGHEQLKVAVNLSARQFRQEDIVHQIQQAITDSGLPVDRLELEITESMVMDNVESAIKTLKLLGAKGITIAMDDFGTGYSSLSHLRRFPIHTLKIDQSFVRELTSNTKDAAIVEAIISLAQGLNLRVVAEGVETKEQADYLGQEGCTEGQGYYYSRPLSAKDFAQFLASHGKP